MGLFSKKKESHTIEEAIKNDDEKFSYTTQSGHTYDDFPFHMTYEYTTSKGNTYLHFPNIVIGVRDSFAGFDDIDDLYEMFAPNLMRLLVETNQNIKTVMQQNNELQQKCNHLEQEIAELKSNLPKKPHQSYQL